MTPRTPITPPATPDLSSRIGSDYHAPQLTPTPSKSLKPSFSTSIRENVQVMVRCRPPSQRELDMMGYPCWDIRPDEGSIELTRLKNSASLSSFHYGIHIEDPFFISEAIFLLFV
jgi:hypothetical protein